ncbi:MAG: MOSC domain-containing protein [Gammaproteobacteria bacterium]
MSELFSWLGSFGEERLKGRLEAIYMASAAGEPMVAVESAEAIPGKGLSGDRYAQGTGHWRLTDGCEVTLVSSKEIQAGGEALEDGRHRRNLVVSGIDLQAARRRRVQIGEVVFEFHRLRPPCGYLDRVSGPGAAKALRKRGGIGLRVVSGGRIRVGDKVRLVDQQPEKRPERRVERP